MRVLRNIFDRLWAALIFFTRLPLWRLYQPPQECYNSVVEFWPLTGWLTGGVMAVVIGVGSQWLPLSVSVVLAIAARLLLTGGLHEDGLADFFDGMGGGGSDRSRVLAIMKDSHIGTFGVLSLIVYFLLLWTVLTSMPAVLAAFCIFVADPYAKMLSGQLILMLPYARTEETAKNRTVYRRYSWKAGLSLLVQGLLPMGLLVYVSMDVDFTWVLMLPAVVFYLLYLFIRHRLHGYTGDCCGAVCLMVELTTCLAMLLWGTM